MMPGPIEQLTTVLATEVQAVDDLIAKRMASDNAPRIPEITAHLIGAGGKRLRPLLTLASAQLCGYSGPFHIHLAATVEFIHTATLLHDDVVDESQRRRGRATANILWDNKSSVLVGDYLFSRAFQLMVETGSLSVLDILANASATIAEGEVLQLTAAGNLNTTESVYMKVVEGKTAALFSAATQVGGVISNASAEKITALKDYGKALGVSFQIADDLLDYLGEKNQLGKNIGDDFRERKLTLPIIKALAKANREEREFWTRVFQEGVQKDGDLEHAHVLLHQSGAITATRKEAEYWARVAYKSLAAFPETEMKAQLQALTHFVVSRVI